MTNREWLENLPSEQFAAMFGGGNARKLNQRAATNTGDQSAATNTGDQSAATTSGKDSVALAWGIESKAKAALGSYIVLAEWEETNNGYTLKCARMHKVDGKVIKPDTFYMLKNGKFVEVKE